MGLPDTVMPRRGGAPLSVPADALGLIQRVGAAQGESCGILRAALREAGAA